MNRHPTASRSARTLVAAMMLAAVVQIAPWSGAATDRANTPRAFALAATPTATRARNPCPPDRTPTGIPVFEQPAPDGAVYVSIGAYTNASKQKFIITVVGRVTKAITDYTSNLRVCLEAARPSGTAPAKAKPPTRKSAALTASLLKDPKTENLFIQIELSAQDAKNYPSGYDLYFVIDPQIVNFAVHHYAAAFLGDDPTTTVRVNLNRVKARLYRNCVLTGTRTISAGGNSTLPTGAGGQAWYDLKVSGDRDGTNRYKITGNSPWNNFYSSPAPVDPDNAVTCD